MPATMLPPIGRSSLSLPGRCDSAGDRRDRWRTAKTASSSSTAAPSSSTIGETKRASAAVNDEPEIAPSVAPAAMKPNSRLPCSGLNRSTFICQKTETTNRL